MKAIATTAIALCLGSFAQAQFVLPAAELAKLPAGTTQKVIAAGWYHCPVGSVGFGSCTRGGNRNTLAAVQYGSNAFDREGNFFYEGADGAVELNLMTPKATTSMFAALAPITTLCIQISPTEAVYYFQDIDHFAFNVGIDALQITTSYYSTTYLAVASDAYASCADGIGGNPNDIATGSDETDAYIVVTGSKL